MNDSQVAPLVKIRQLKPKIVDMQGSRRQPVAVIRYAWTPKIKEFCLDEKRSNFKNPSINLQKAVQDICCKLILYKRDSRYDIILKKRRQMTRIMIFFILWYLGTSACYLTYHQPVISEILADTCLFVAVLITSFILFRRLSVLVVFSYYSDDQSKTRA